MNGLNEYKYRLIAAYQWFANRPLVRSGLFGVILAAGLQGQSAQVHAQSVAALNPANWAEYGGGADNAHFSSLTQINKENVKELKQSWFFPAPTSGGRFGFNPVIVDGVMYVQGANNTINALNAETGTSIWSVPNEQGITNRGINYWESDNRSDRRLFYSSGDMLRAIDARTGAVIKSFGTNGTVNLRENLDRDPRSVNRIQSGTPGRVYRDLIIMGSATGEDYASPPGHVRAYNVVTGKLVWTFRPIPAAGTPGSETWPKGYDTYIGGGNVWGEITVDYARGIAYLPTSSPTYDFYGADRAGNNLYTDSIVALEASTGKVLWHFQLIHHDLWDFDTVTAPQLITVNHEGRTIDAVAQPTKQGFLFVFDRVTGKPLWPIEERPVAKSLMPLERASPTQPFPTKPAPFARQEFTEADVNPFITDPADVARVKAWVRNARNEGLYTPPGLADAIQVPGNNGGANWGSAGANPKKGLVFIMSKDAPTMLRLEAQRPRGGFNAPPAVRGAGFYESRCVGCHGIDRKGHAGMGTPVVDVVQRLGAETTAQVIKNGRNTMPPFAAMLNDANIEDIVAFLKDPAAADVPVRGGGGGGRAEAEVEPPSTPGQRFFTGYGTMNAENGLPAIGPPWSTLTAYDLNLGTIKWQVPLGTVPSLAAKGFTNTGSYWPRGGPVVTAGGLVFAGTGGDQTVRAYDQDTGEVLWEHKLATGPEGIPAVYEVNGRQYVVFCTRSGDAADNLPANPNQVAQAKDDPAAQGYYVFALPKR